MKKRKILGSVVLGLAAITAMADNSVAAQAAGVSAAAPAPTKHAKSSKHSHKKKSNYMYGKATYYGGSDGFEGKRMANGKIFHAANVNVAAHPTLPLGTKLRVTDITTNRTIYVEVTDRMAKRGRVIDLSKGGARALGMAKSGTSTVHLSIISDDEYRAKYDTIEEYNGDDGLPR